MLVHSYYLTPWTTITAGSLVTYLVPTVPTVHSIILKMGAAQHQLLRCLACLVRHLGNHGEQLVDQGIDHNCEGKGDEPAFWSGRQCDRVEDQAEVLEQGGDFRKGTGGDDGTGVVGADGVIDLGDDGLSKAGHCDLPGDPVFEDLSKLLAKRAFASQDKVTGKWITSGISGQDGWTDGLVGFVFNGINV